LRPEKKGKKKKGRGERNPRYAEEGKGPRLFRKIPKKKREKKVGMRHATKKRRESKEGGKGKARGAEHERGPLHKDLKTVEEKKKENYTLPGRERMPLIRKIRCRIKKKEQAFNSH